MSRGLGACFSYCDHDPRRGQRPNEEAGAEQPGAVGSIRQPGERNPAKRVEDRKGEAGQ
jgi:hypothetical protein